MPSELVIYDREKINSLTQTRPGETKFGEKVQLAASEEDLESQLEASEAKFVLFGIPEDLGVRGNLGKPGTRHAWNAALKALLNIQSNKHTKGSKVLVLGHLDFNNTLEEIDQLTGDNLVKKSRKITEDIDKEVTDLVRKIISSGKIPIIIGGGHNNAYGNIKGCSLAHSAPVNAINIDAHTDFRQRESRHSGNGFSWAYYEGFLNKYFIFGLHENYTSKKLFEAIDEKERIKYNTFEELFVRKTKGFTEELDMAVSFVKSRPFGVEIDMDAIAYMPSSAMTPSGLTLEMVRQIVYKCGSKKNVAYLHLCEAAPNPKDPASMALTGKALAYLISDFIRK